jgi:hypothetical protein
MDTMVVCADQREMISCYCFSPIRATFGTALTSQKVCQTAIKGCE